MDRTRDIYLYHDSLSEVSRKPLSNRDTNLIEEFFETSEEESVWVRKGSARSERVFVGLVSHYDGKAKAEA